MQWPVSRPAGYLGSLIALLIMVLGPASRAETEMQEFIQLYVRNKHTAGKDAFTADRILLYVPAPAGSLRGTARPHE